MCDFITQNKHLFEQLDIFINSLDKKEDALIRTLHQAQNIFGYIPQDVQIYISDKLDIPFDKVSKLVNFYSYFTTDLKGEFKINICVGRTCNKNNSNKILAEFENQLGIKVRETTKDLKFTLDTTGCVGTCRKSPVVTVNGRDFNGVTIEDVSSILKQYN